MRTRWLKRLLSNVFISILLAFGTIGCGLERQHSDYGVFLSVTDDLESLSGFSEVVIDAQFFSKKDIEAFQSGGRKVYSYINVGSIEDFREYYSEYEDITLGEYEHWDEERWVDVSDFRWQYFLIKKLIPSLLEKNVDGFFVDNCDVYYIYPTEEIYYGLTNIMSTLVKTGKAVLINGGDAYLDAYCRNGGKWNEVITGINQETVFTKILWDEDKFGVASSEDRRYFQDYIERYADMGADIYLIEYTHDVLLADKVRKYCRQKGFYYYISDSLELD